MAMGKEEQRAAAERILKKHPLTADEEKTLARLRLEPGEYPADRGEGRKCLECGAVFQGDEGMTAMQKFSDHQAFHNPSPARWAEAHKRIEAGKDRAKKQPE